MTYEALKAKKILGETLTLAELDAAIVHQSVVVGLTAGSLAKHAAKLVVKDQHPFPLPEDQVGRVARRGGAFDHEIARLVRLNCWRELASLGVTA